MSNSVDEKVVSLKFDNSDFEQKADKSISSLEKLNKSIDFSNHQKGGKGLEALSQTIKASDLSGMEKSVSTISERFTNLGIVGVTALQNITNKAVDAGEKLIKSLTIDPIMSGMNEYELKMGSMRTILASTRDQFKNEAEAIDVINEKLNELNKYSDETIYSFSDMTNNIGKFTNAGVDLDTAVQAIKGISNEAAISGANANEASRAMYNFSQALSAGYVKLIDWKSIENANMATKEFKEQLIQTAVATHNLTKKGKVYLTSKGQELTATKNFNDSLKDGWMTTEVLTQTLNQYATSYKDLSKDQKDAYMQQLIGMGYTDKQIKKIIELGEKAQGAASEITTWSKLVDTLQEAVQSGWAQTFEILFGNIKEATDLWTGLGNALSNIISKTSDARNNMLQEWKDAGGRAALLKGIANILKYIGSLLKPIGTAFREVFNPASGKALAALSLRFEAFTKKLKASKDTINNIKDTFKGLFSIIGLAKDIAFGLVKAILPATGAAGSLGSSIFAITGAIGRFISSGVKFVRNSKIIQKAFGAIAAVVRIIVGAINKAAKTFVHFVTTITQAGNGRFKKIISHISDLARALGGGLAKSAKTARDLFSKYVTPVFHKFGEKVNSVRKSIINYITDTGSPLEKVAKKTKSGFELAKDSITKFGKEAKDKIGGKTNGASSKALSVLGDSFKKFGGALKSLGHEVGGFIGQQFDKLKELASGLHIVDKLSAGISYLADKITTLAGKLSMTVHPIESFKKALDPKQFTAYAKAAGETTKQVEKLGKTGEKSSTSKSTGIGGYAETVKSQLMDLYKWVKATPVAETLTDVFDRIKTAVKGLTDFSDIDRSIDRGLGLTKIIGGMKMMSSAAKMMKSAAGVFNQFGGLLSGLTGTITSFGNLATQAQKSLKIQAFKTIAISISLIAGSLFVISKIPMKRLKTSIAIMGGIFVALIATLKILTSESVDEKKLTSLGIAFGAMGGSLLLISISAKILAGIPWKNLLKSAVSLMAFIGMMVAAGALANRSIKDLGGLIAISVAIGLLIPSILIMSRMSFDTLVTGGTAIFSFIVMMGLAGRIAGKNKAGLAGFLGMSAAVVAMVPAIIMLAMLPIEKSLKAALALSAIMYALAGAVRLASTDKKGGALMAAALAAMITGLTGALIALALVPFGKLLKSVLALSAVMVAFGYVMKEVSGIKATDAVAMAGLMSMIAGIVYMVASMDAASAMRSLGPLGVFIASLAVTVKLMGTASINAKAALKGFAVIGIVMVAIEGVLVAVAALDSYIGDGKVMNVLKKATKIGPLIGEAIGGFFGGLVGGFVSAGLVSIARNLTTFMTELQPFLSMASDVKPTVATGIKNLAAAVAYLTAANILNNINNLFSSGDGDSLAGMVKSFAKGLGTFIEVYVNIAEKAGALKDDQLNAVSKVATALKDFAAAAEKMPAKGGLRGLIMGNKDVDSFSEGVKSFGKIAVAIAATEFPKGWKSKLQDLSDVLGDLGDAAQKIPETKKGWKQKLLGMKDIGKFAEQLKDFAPKFSEFSQSISSDKSINADSMKKISALADVVKDLGIAADKIPSDMDEGSIKAKLVGVKNLPQFADQMKAMADKIPGLIAASKGLDEGSTKRITMMANIIKTMANAADAIHAISNDKKGGDGADTQAMINNLSSFTSNMKGYVKAFKGFAKSAAGIDEGQLKAASSVAKSIKKMSEAAAIVSGIKGGGSDIEEKLKGLAKGLSSYAKKVNGLDVGNLEANTEALKSSIKATTKALSGGNKSAKSSASSAISSYVKGLKSGANTKGASAAAASVRKAALDALNKTSGFTKAGNAAVSKYVAAVGKAKGAKGAGKDLAGKAKDAAKDVNFNSAGVSAAEGFAAGLRDSGAVEEVASAGTALGKAAYDAAKKAIKSSSPSKKFMELGRYSDEGMAIGLNKYSDLVYKAGKKVGIAGLEGTRNSISDLDLMLTDPHITPVLDLSNVQKGADQINSMLGNSANIDANLMNVTASRQNGGKLEETIDKLGKVLNDNIPSDNSPKEMYSIGDVTVDVSKLEDVTTLNQFVDILKMAKSIA